MKKHFITLVTLLVAMTALAAQKQTKDMTQSGPIVDIKTSVGDIKIRLFDDTPKHRDNFVKLASEGYYDGVLFHRVIKDFMVQTGDPDSRDAAPDVELGSGDPGYRIDAEIVYPTHWHKRGVVAAARTDNPARQSSGSQFYIVTGSKLDSLTAERQVTKTAQKAYWDKLTAENAEKIKALRLAHDRAGLDSLQQELIERVNSDVKKGPQEIIDSYVNEGGTPWLDNEYTVFGEVISGMDTVAKIEQAETNASDRPKEDIRIISMKVEGMPKNKK